jgi:membrane-associated phospholipid phosphatase
VKPASPAPITRARFQWAVLAVGAAVVVLLGLSVRHTTGPTAWEHPIVTTAERFPFPFRDYLIEFFEPIPFAFASIALAFAAAARGRTRLAIPGLGGCLAAVIATELVLKPLFDRTRLVPVGPHNRLIIAGGPMFPSAHTTAAAAFATFAWLIVDKNSRLKPFILALPLLVGWSVMAKHMHFPADILAGYIVGPIVVYCTVSAVRVTTRRFEEPLVERDPVSASY